MIRRLSLTNWRNYADVDVPFEAGTTFVVAANGIGKSSLVEAARWALFGHIADTGTAVRAGETVANATVEIVLPSMRILTISRDLVTRKNSRTPYPAPEATVDGARIKVAELEELIAEEYKTEPTFLASVTMPPVDLAAARPDNLGLEEHLGRYYGVHGLRHAADVLNQRKTETNKKIAGVKTTNAASAKLLTDMLDQTRQAADDVVAAETAHAETRVQLQAAQRNQADLAQTVAWQAQQQAWTAEVDQLHREFVAVADSLPIEPAARSDIEEGEFTATLATAVETQRAAITEVDVRLAVIANTIETLNSNRARLEAAHDDCPVCRRPLDDTTIEAAGAAAAHDVAILHDERDTLTRQRADLAEALASLTDIQGRAHMIRSLPSAPAPADPAADDADPDELARLEHQALETMIQARTRLATAQQNLESAQAADEAMRELQALFDQQARLSIALDATEKTLRDLLDDAVRPMASAVNARWMILFPDRGPLTTSSDGTVTRTVNNEALSFDSFSTGEGAGLTLLIRLVVASMATKADFCWFDEPLEHMDPDTRRHVASMLTRAGSGDGPLQQIVVTTYEEPLARQLNVRDPDRVHLIDVRQSEQAS